MVGFVQDSAVSTADKPYLTEETDEIEFICLRNVVKEPVLAYLSGIVDRACRERRNLRVSSFAIPAITVKPGPIVAAHRSR